MKVSLIYLHVKSKGYESAPDPGFYVPFEKRFSETYKKFDPGAEHALHIVCCGGHPDDEVRSFYSGITAEFSDYSGAGSDIGACQDAMKRVGSDFCINMSTPVYFWRDGWLKRLVDARAKFGDGLYGPMASMECSPHIRTSCWGVDPNTFSQYPHLIDTREKCYWAEHRDQSAELWHITRWYQSMGKPAMQVTWDEVLDQQNWRRPPNIFCRGDQSNCIVRDRYSDLFDAYTEEEKDAVSKRVDGVTQ